MRKYIFFKLEKKLPSPANKFLLHTLGAIGKLKNKIIVKKIILKKCASPEISIKPNLLLVSI